MRKGIIIQRPALNTNWWLSFQSRLMACPEVNFGLGLVKTLTPELWESRGWDSPVPVIPELTTRLFRLYPGSNAVQLAFRSRVRTAGNKHVI